MEKSIWDKLKILNERDSKDGTRLVSLSNTMVSANLVSQGGHVTMGVDRECFDDIVLSDKKVSVLLMVIDKDEFDKL